MIFRRQRSTNTGTPTRSFFASANLFFHCETRPGCVVKIELRSDRSETSFACYTGRHPMTKQEKKRLAGVLRATEYLFLENIALKLVLEHREVPNWQKLLEHLLADKEMLAGIRLKFRDIYAEIEGSGDPTAALESLVGEIPAAKKTH